MASTVATVRSINYNMGALKELSSVEAEDVNIKTGAQSNNTEKLFNL